MERLLLRMTKSGERTLLVNNTGKSHLQPKTPLTRFLLEKKFQFDVSVYESKATHDQRPASEEPQDAKNLPSQCLDQLTQAASQQLTFEEDVKVRLHERTLQTVDFFSNANDSGEVTTESLSRSLRRHSVGKDERSAEVCAKLRNNIGIVLDNPRHPGYAVLSLRKETFHNWPLKSETDTDILAECGFVYEGNGDQVRCFHCSVVVNGFAIGEDPWVVHAEEFPYCAHVRMNKGDNFILRMYGEPIDEGNGHGDDKVKLSMDCNRFAIEAVRTIYNFNDTLIQEAVEALLSKNFPLFTGADLVKTIEELQNDQLNVVKRPGLDEDETSLEDLEQERERLEDSVTCKICFENIACVIFLSCGHIACCPQCVSALTNCPICRSQIKGSVRAFFASDPKIRKHTKSCD